MIGALLWLVELADAKAISVKKHTSLLAFSLAVVIAATVTSGITLNFSFKATETQRSQRKSACYLDLPDHPQGAPKSGCNELKRLGVLCVSVAK
jgi:hypothetical protein